MTVLSRAPNTSPPGNPFQHYKISPEFYDEMLRDRGEFRAHWQPFVHALEALGLAELSRRWEEAKHLIHADRVTYNVHADPRSTDRPWELDPIPLLISVADGQAIEAGLIQRAKLLEQVLADLYGKQQLVRDGLIPPDLVFDNPAFLRAC